MYYVLVIKFEWLVAKMKKASEFNKSQIVHNRIFELRLIFELTLFEKKT
jgi:hypothetical protein